MSMIMRGDILVCSNDNIGFAYIPTKGKLYQLSVDGAKLLEKQLDEYWSGTMANEESRVLEQYVMTHFLSCDNLVRHPNSYGLHNISTLYKLEIMIANQCNLDCAYCYAHGGTYDSESCQILSPDNAERYLRSIIQNRYDKVGTVMFFGGEPTLGPKTIEAVCNYFEYAYQNGDMVELPIYTMVSNGTLIDKDMASIISRYHIRTTVSVDGPPEINDALRVDKGGNGSYQRIKEGIQNLNTCGFPPVLLEATYTTKHIEAGLSKHDVVDFLRKEFGVKKVLIENCVPNGIHDELAVKNDQPNIDDLSGEYYLTRTKFETLRRLRTHEFIDYSCSAGIESFCILPDGRVFPCHQFIHDEQYCMGTIDSLFASEQYEFVHSMLTNMRKCNYHLCSTCWAKQLCRIPPCQMLLFPEEMNRTCELVKKETILNLFHIIEGRKDTKQLGKLKEIFYTNCQINKNGGNGQ